VRGALFSLLGGAALLGAVAGMAPATAEPIIFSGAVEGRLGYGTNPLLRDFSNAGSGFGQFSFQPTLTRTTARGTTTLQGNYTREQYFRRYDHSESITGSLGQTQQFSERVSGNARIGYTRTDNPLLGAAFDPDLIDVLAIGQRTTRIFGDAGLQVQPTARDGFSIGANASHTTYGKGGTLIPRDYDQYGGNVAYNHTLSARTKVGLQVSATQLRSKYYPDTRSIQPAVTLSQVLSPIWTFNGSVGVIFQDVPGPFGGSTTSLGFQGALCGTYPRTTVCVSGGRQSSASGIGGLRNTLQASLDVDHKLTERSKLSAALSYTDSSSIRESIAGDPRIGSSQRVLLVRGDYSHDVSQRVSVGFGARGQLRSTPGYGSRHGIAGTINIRAKIGRLTS